MIAELAKYNTPVVLANTTTAGDITLDSSTGVADTELFVATFTDGDASRTPITNILEINNGTGVSYVATTTGGDATLSLIVTLTAKDGTVLTAITSVTSKTIAVTSEA
ncbi:MAG: hypothetical protein R3Y53_03840 [Bacillota bacterium]